MRAFRELRGADLGHGGFYNARVFTSGGLVVLRGRETAYIPAVHDPTQGRITAGQLVARVEPRPLLLFARSTGAKACTFRRLPPGADLVKSQLQIGSRAFSGWTELDHVASQAFLSCTHYIVRDPYPLTFRPLAQIPDALETPQLNELTEDQVKDLQTRGILGHNIPRGHSVFRIVSAMHEIHDSLFPEIVIESVVCDEVKGTITFNYSLKLTLADPDRFGRFASPAAYVAVDTTRVGPRSRFTLVRSLNKSEGAQP